VSSLEPRATATVTRAQIARYAGAVGDFNPIHVDEEFARAAGLPSVIAHGPLTLTLAIDTLVAQVGADALRRFDARLKAPVVPGDTLTVVPADDSVEVRTGSGNVVATANVTVERGE
jgi:acyl dehydratase